MAILSFSPPVVHLRKAEYRRQRQSWPRKPNRLSIRITHTLAVKRLVEIRKGGSSKMTRPCLKRWRRRVKLERVVNIRRMCIMSLPLSRSSNRGLHVSISAGVPVNNSRSVPLPSTSTYSPFSLRHYTAILREEQPTSPSRPTTTRSAEPHPQQTFDQTEYESRGSQGLHTEQKCP